MTSTLDTAPALRPGASPMTVLRLHLALRRSLLLTPPGILVMVFVVTAIIALIFLRTGTEPGSAAWVDGSRSNAGVMWALPGFFGWIGVQTVALSFPLALALGSTRRAFALGTVATHVLLALYVTALLLVLLGVEKLTHQWFLDLYVIDVVVLGGGDPVRLAVIGFLGTLLVLSVGGVMAAAWVRHGAKGPTVLAVVSVLVLGGILVLIIPSALNGFELWWLAVAAIVMTVLSVLGQYLFLLRASVR